MQQGGVTNSMAGQIQSWRGQRTHLTPKRGAAPVSKKPRADQHMDWEKYAMFSPQDACDLRSPCLKVDSQWQPNVGLRACQGCSLNRTALAPAQARASDLQDVRGPCPAYS